MFSYYIITFLWLVCFLVAVFAPLRWSMVAFLCISAIDFGGGRGTFASYNVLKGLVLPVILLWRTRGYSGHRNVVAGWIGWMLLMAYIAIASFWSLFPESAAKLVFQMLGTTITVLVLVRATKGGYLTAKTAVYAAIGALALGVSATFIAPGWGDESSRFSSFMSAQGYASFLVGLYCVLLCGREIAVWVRIVVCSALTIALLFDGSRTWFMGLILATGLSVMLSRGQVWFKICASALCVGLLAAVIGGADSLLRLLSQSAAGNRIASAVTAAYEGNTGSAGLGTFNFRREINDAAIDQIKRSSASQLLFGRGTCNGAIITGTRFHAYSQMLDPNRMFHNEWLRVVYEWGLIGAACWLLFIGSLIRYAIQGWKRDRSGNAKPLLIYLPSFLIALSTENMLAGSVNAVSMAFLFTIALASIPYRRRARRVAQVPYQRVARELDWSPSNAVYGVRA